MYKKKKKKSKDEKRLVGTFEAEQCIVTDGVKAAHTGRCLQTRGGDTDDVSHSVRHQYQRKTPPLKLHPPSLNQKGETLGR